MLIDSHCHLNYEYDGKSAEDLVREAKAAGVEFLISIGTDPPNHASMVKISEEFENVFHTVGVHPHEAATLKDPYLQDLRAWAAHPKCRAIGEIGLDYHYNHSPRETQRARFREQLELALELGQPVIIHARDAEPDLIEDLGPYSKRAKIPGVIHCFSGTQDFGQRCLDFGFYISFSGILTFKNAEALRAACRSYPLERLLVETDSPYLAPVPFRGKKCEPSMVKWTALKVAELHQVPFEKVCELTTRNARHLFRI